MGASPGEALGHGVKGIASIETPSEASEVALGMFGADMMVGASERGLDVAERRVHPLEWGQACRFFA